MKNNNNSGKVDSNHLSKFFQARLKITPRALEKAETYARLVAEEFGRLNESIGFLLADKGSGNGPDIIITDVMLAHDQNVSMGSAQISPSGVLASGREIQNRGKTCVGFWHAHPNITFHSGTDDQNLEMVLEEVSVSNHWPLTEPKSVPVRWEDGALVIRTGTETVRIKGEALAAISPGDSDSSKTVDLEAEVQSEALTGSVAYSLVVSASGKSRPYAKKAMKVYCALCGRRETQDQEVAIELVELGQADIKAMRAEIRKKVRNLSSQEETCKGAIVVQTDDHE